MRGFSGAILLTCRKVKVGKETLPETNHSVKGGKMIGGRASAVFGETLCLPARSRFGEGRAAPLPV